MALHSAKQPMPCVTAFATMRARALCEGVPLIMISDPRYTLGTCP